MTKLFIALTLLTATLRATGQEINSPNPVVACEREYKKMAYEMSVAWPVYRKMTLILGGAGVIGANSLYRALRAGPLGRLGLTMTALTAMMATGSFTSSVFSYALAADGPIFKLIGHAITDTRESRVGGGVEGLTALINAAIYKPVQPREVTFSAHAKLGKVLRRNLRESLNSAPLTSERVLPILQDMMANQELCAPDGTILSIHDFTGKIVSRLLNRRDDPTAPPTEVVSPAR